MRDSRNYADHLAVPVFGIILCLLGYLVLRVAAPVSASRPAQADQVVQAPEGIRPLGPAEVPEATRQRVLEAYGKLPLYFIANQGQLDPRVAYYVQGRDTSIYFTDRGVTLTIDGDANSSSEALVRPVAYRGMSAARALAPHAQARRWVVKLDFVDANPKVRPVGQQPTAAVISYFKGPREEWKTGLPTYASLVYRDLWPGIDLVYSGTANHLKSTFLVQPGADPNQIKLSYRGATAVRINDAGQLKVSTPLGGFHEDKPYAYQEVPGRRLEVAAAYVLGGEASDGMQYSFRVGPYNQRKLLVLDPVVFLYAGYIGGAGFDLGHGIAVDPSGNAYITGETTSSQTSFPDTVGPDLTYNGGGSDAFVAKVNATGSALDYAGYIGGSGADIGFGIAVDPRGNAYVAGQTGSSAASFPDTVGPDLTYNTETDAFVAKVGRSGPP